MNEFNNLESLNLIANIFQILDLSLNLSQTSNDQLMKELLKQDKEYLEKILKNQNEIINKLDKLGHSPSGKA